MRFTSDMSGFAAAGGIVLAQPGSADLAIYDRVDYLTALGTSTYITLGSIPYVSQGTPIKIWKNGVLLFYGSDYTVSGNIVNLTVSTTLGDKLVIEYSALRMQSVSALSPVLTNWDPNNIGAQLVLSNLNRTLSTIGTVNAWCTGKSQASRSSGKRIFEMQMTSNGAGNGVMFGLCDAGQSLSDYLTHSGGSNSTAVQYTNNLLYVLGFTNAAFGTPTVLAQNDFRLYGTDLSAGKVWISKKRATSTTSLATAGSGSKVFTTQSGRVYPVNDRITATSAATGEWMSGLVTAYSSTSLTVTMDSNSGTGTHADWNIDGWIGGGNPDAGTTPTLTFTPGPTLYAAAALNGSGGSIQSVVYNGAGSFTLTPQNATTFTPWDV